jgi:hypothetical protein
MERRDLRSICISTADGMSWKLSWEADEFRTPNGRNGPSENGGTVLLGGSVEHQGFRLGVGCLAVSRRRPLELERLTLR